jgi:DNA invertase Pin-like site-specific DNA recombinase
MTPHPDLRPVPDTPPRVGLYRRVSRVMGRRDERFLSPALQDEILTRQLDARFGVGGYRVVWHPDAELDVSGGVAARDRPILRQGLDLARRGELDYLAVYEMTRWSRDTAGGLDAMREIEQAGCRLLNAGREVDLSNPDDEFSATIDLAVATRYRRQVAEGWRRVHQHLLEQGHHHGAVPLGLQRRDIVPGRTTPAGQPTRTGPLVPDELAPHVTAALEAFAAERPVSRICADFTASTGHTLTRQQLHKMVGNRMYLGYVTYAGEERPGIHQPLIDPATWELCQARRAREARMPSRSVIPGHALAGIAACGHCQRGVGKVRDGHGRTALRCQTATHQHTCPGIGAPRLDHVEALVVADLAAWAADIVAAPPVRPTADTARLNRQHAALAATRARLATALADGHMDGTAYAVADRPLAQQQAALDARLAELAIPHPAPASAETVPSLLADWHLLTGSERAAVLRGFGGRVTIWRGPKVETRWGATDRRRGPKPA